jgi:glycosyltransferase involved in cell wall biosynthesis
MSLRVLVVAMGDIAKDVRIIKEVLSLQSAGHRVEAIGVKPGKESETTDYKGMQVTLVGRDADAYKTQSTLRRLYRAGVAGFFLLTTLALGVVLIAEFWARVKHSDIAVPLTATFMLSLASLAASLLALLGMGQLLFRIKDRLVALTAGIEAAIRRAVAIAPTEGRYVAGNAVELAALEPPTLSRWNLLRHAADPAQRGWLVFLDRLNRAVLAEARHRQFDVVHCHDFSALPVGLALKRERPEASLVYDSHELFSAVVGERPLDHSRVRRVEEAASGLLDAAITVNDSIADKLKSYYPRMPRPVVVCNATPAPTSAVVYDGRLHAAAKLPRHTKILLFQGGFAKNRGLDALVASAPLLPAGWAVVLMGWGRHQSALEDILASSEYRKRDPDLARVRIIPAVEQRELSIWTAGGTIGAIPYEPSSLNHYYCSPNKIWEYPAAGVPVLCSAAPEMANRVKGYGFGWVLPFEKLTGPGIAEAVAALDDAEIARAREACRRFIAADNWSVYEARLLELYAGLAERPVAPVFEARSLSPARA